MAKINALVAQITKDYGDVMLDAGHLIETQGEVIKTLPSLDLALSGGIAEGTITVMASPPKAGKTTTCLSIIAAAQRQFKKQCYYIDVENRLRTELLHTIKGLVWTEEQSKETGIPCLKIVKSSKGNFLTAEKYLNIIDTIFKTEEGAFVVLDSIAALCTEELQGIKMGESKQMMTIPSLMYSLMRKIAQVLPCMRSNLICITHLQATPNSYKAPVGMGGNAQEFFASNRLVCYSSQKEEVDGEEVGKNTKFKVTASALGKPGGEAMIYIRYGRGCDREEDIAQVSEDMGFILKGGAWYSFTDETGKEHKFQGKKNLVEFLKENPKIADMLETKIRELAFGSTTDESSNSGKK